MAFYYATSEYDAANVVITGMPLDRTSSHVPGTRFGPDAARLAAENIESFSPYQLRDVGSVRVHDAGNLEFSFETPDSPLDLIARTVRANRQAGKAQLALGGEHTVTPAIVAELARSEPKLCVLQLDAHADLRDTYLGEKWCHATAMRRVLDCIPRSRLFQVGVRSFAAAEEMKAENVFPFQLLSHIDAVKKRIGARPCYLTLDTDILDPGVLPEVQTPQPGGNSYEELARTIAGLAELRVVACDVVEFCPRTSQPSPGASVVAELVRELVLLLAGGPRRSGGSV